MSIKTTEHSPYKNVSLSWQNSLSESLAAIEKATGYQFQKPELLFEALTHSSAAQEVQRKKKISLPWNERLEFLGDSILSLALSTHLTLHPENFAEGNLSKIRAALVNEKSLAGIAKSIGLGQMLLFSVGEMRAEGHKKISVLADAFEALLGAIYLDGGFEVAESVILGLFQPLLSGKLEDLIQEDFKTRLQELTQRYCKQTPSYTLIGESGPDHNKVFSIEVSFKSVVLARAEGTNKKKASQNAARKALEFLAQNPHILTKDSFKETGYVPLNESLQL